MSIATDEALKAEDSVLERELNGTSWLIGFERGYIAGRTASTTDKEVDAAAFAMWRLDQQMERLNPAGYDFEAEWSALSPPAQGEYRVRADVAFSAAWETVTE
jgi:hypothetical protein